MKKDLEDRLHEDLSSLTFMFTHDSRSMTYGDYKCAFCGEQSQYTRDARGYATGEYIDHKDDCLGKALEAHFSEQRELTSQEE